MECSSVIRSPIAGASLENRLKKICRNRFQTTVVGRDRKHGRTSTRIVFSSEHDYGAFKKAFLQNWNDNSLDG